MPNFKTASQTEVEAAFWAMLDAEEVIDAAADDGVNHFVCCDVTVSFCGVPRRPQESYDFVAQVACQECNLINETTSCPICGGDQ